MTWYHIAVVAMIIVGIAGFLWFADWVICEVVRKLGREVSTLEIILIWMTFPYSVAYIVIMMPEPSVKSSAGEGVDKSGRQP